MKDNIIQLIPSLITNRSLELILLPTEQCNFRCTYCYEDFSLGKMTRDVIDGVKNLISKRASELKFLKISWFGGEPLSARDIVYEISQHAKNICESNGIKFQGGMTTNAFLLTETVATKLYILGIRNFQISLDGPKKTHDLTRQRIDKSGSFERIWNNLLDLRNSKLLVSIILRIHITPENYESLFLLIEDLKIYFGGDTRFKIFFKAIANLGGKNAKNIQTLNKDVKEIAIEKLIEAVDNKLNVISVKDSLVPFVCYAAQANSFMIRADGTIGKCTVALNDSRNSIGKILKDGTMQFESGKILPWIRGVRTLDKNTLYCPLMGMDNEK